MSDNNLLNYKWTGINRQGRRLKGTIEAADLKAAEAELHTREIDIISIKLIKKTGWLGSARVKTRDIVLFTRYLTTMLSAGLPILQSLDIISRDPSNETMRSAVSSIKNSVASGTTLGDSLSQYPKYFDELYISLVRAGEKSGTLEKVLKRLVKYMERIEMLKTKIRNALIYPAAIVSVAVVVSLILLIFVIPQFQVIFQNAGAQLPYFTRLVIGFSDILRHYWWLFLVVIIGGAWGIRSQMRSNPRFAYWVDKRMLTVFVLGSIIRKGIIARFTRTLAITLESGLPIVESMRSMVHIMGNRVYSQAINEVCEKLSNGNPLSTSLANTNLFPNMTIQMIAVGEASGSLSEMLNVVANYYEEEVNNIADNLSNMVEPAIIVILGVIIGCFVVAMYLPIFKIGSAVQG